MNPLSEWNVFYEIVGSAAGALTGLQFVSMALISEVPIADSEEDASAAFSTPSVVFFTTVLLLAGMMAMPWRTMAFVEGVWLAAGLAGMVYISLAAWKLKRQTAYKPVMEDWIFRIVLPLLAYALLGAAGVVGWCAGRLGMFCAAGAVMFLLTLGIHNAWDNVIYLVFMTRKARAKAFSRENKS